MRIKTAVVSFLAVVVATAAVGSGRAPEPEDNRYVRVAYYKEKTPSKNPPLHYVLFVEFGVKSTRIGPFEYGVLVDEPDRIERTSSLAYFGSPGEGICPKGKILNASASKLPEEDRQAGFHGGRVGDLPLSPRRSLYARIYSTEPVELYNAFIGRTDGVGRARDSWEDLLQLEVVEAEPCVNGPFTYEPSHAD